MLKRKIERKKNWENVQFEQTKREKKLFKQFSTFGRCCVFVWVSKCTRSLTYNLHLLLQLCDTRVHPTRISFATCKHTCCCSQLDSSGSIGILECAHCTRCYSYCTLDISIYHIYSGFFQFFTVVYFFSISVFNLILQMLCIRSML